MTTASTYISNLIEDLQNSIDINQDMLSRFPDSRLYHTTKSGKKKFFKIPLNRTVTDKININAEPQEIKILMQKLYLEAQGKVLNTNLKLTNQFMDSYAEPTMENVVNAMSYHDQQLDFEEIARDIEYGADAGIFTQDEVYKHQDFIITPQMRSRINSHQSWASSTYNKSTFRPQDLTKITSRNEAMRTKAEVMVAEALYKFEIPFQYERVLPFGNIDYAPDFTFEESTRELLRLEYCGMMHDPEYVRKHFNRLKNYASMGIIPGINLICIYNQDNEINMQEVESVIKYQIIPRL